MAQVQPIQDQITSRIKSGPHYRFLFEPATFDERRIPSTTKLRPFLEQKSVLLRGWDFPHMPRRDTERLETKEYFTAWSDFMGHHECWRMYRSGLFASLKSIREEDPDYKQKLASNLFIEGSIKPTSFLSIYDSLWQLTEAHEFLSRLCAARVYPDGVTFNVEIHGTRGRALSFGEPGRYLHNVYMAGIDIIHYSNFISEADALVKPCELALNAAIEIYRDFNGAEFSEEVLKDLQAELYSFR